MKRIPWLVNYAVLKWEDYVKVGVPLNTGWRRSYHLTMAVFYNALIDVGLACIPSKMSRVEYFVYRMKKCFSEGR